PLPFVIAPPASALASLDTPPELASERSQARNAVDVALLESLTLIQKTAEKDQRSFEQSRVNGYSRALAAMAKALNAVEGRKQVLYFSEGFDSKLLLCRSDLTDQDSVSDNQNIAAGRSWLVDNDARYGNTGVQTGINRMLEEFRRANCVIQAVDIGGLRADGDATGQVRANGEEGLFYLANETGGELLKDTNDLGAQLSQVLSHTSLTYILTFSRSDLPENGAYHRLKVKAKLPSGARLSHRAGYYAPRPFGGLDPLEKTLLAADGIASAAPRRDLRFNLLVAPFRATETRGYVPVIVEVPGKGLLTGMRGDRLGLELYAYGSDARGEMKDFFSQTVGLDIKKGRKLIEETGVKYYGHLDLPPGDYRIRVLIRNIETGRTGVESVALSVPPYTAERPVLLPPFFMEAPQSWALVRERTAESGAQAVVYPFTVNGQPYVPAARPALKREVQARVCLVAYNLGAGDVSLAGQVLGSDGKARTGGTLSLVERTATGVNGLDKLIATFKPEGLGDGDYVLQVAVTDPKTGMRETNSVPFEVKD
ncbi:MAG TPA: VWA domain-containing protein, partial [Thermoanaerobaculia bacterium]